MNEAGRKSFHMACQKKKKKGQPAGLLAKPPKAELRAQNKVKYKVSAHRFPKIKQYS